MRLVAEELQGRRGGRTLFGPLSFVLAPGKALLVRGANGAGKSTLLRILAGLLAPSAGDVRLESGSLAGDAHFLSTENAMKPALTVAENLGFWRDFFCAQAEGSPAAGKALSVNAALAVLGLSHTASLPFAALSTGQRRRVALARLALHHRPLWLLDEPGMGLDAASQEMLSARMREHMEKGGMVVAAVHDDPGLPDAAAITLGDTIPE